MDSAQVHQFCREALRAGGLPLPVSGHVTSSGFRAIVDQRLAYHVAGSFVLRATERFGLPPVLRFFQTSNAADELDVIRERVAGAFGVSLEELERSWLVMLPAEWVREHPRCASAPSTVSSRPAASSTPWRTSALAKPSATSRFVETHAGIPGT